MRNIAVVFMLLIFACSVGAQEINISDLDPQQADPELIDVSDASFYFQGPVQVYVQNLKYAGRSYAAVLDYDGGRTVEIFAPRQYGAGIRPQTIDLSNVGVRVNSDATVTLRNAVIDGYRYAATLEYAGGNEVVATGAVARLGEAPSSSAASAQRVERLQDELADARDEIREKEQRIGELRGGNQVVSDLQDQVQERDQRISSLRDRVNALESRIQQLRSPRLPRLPRELHAGFGGLGASFGEWANPGSALEQTDGDAKFAKAVFPVRQSGSEFTYSVEASTPDEGWVGYGIHFLANGSNTAAGYGYGDSYLIWVTRDPKNQTNRGYVQLYRSYDDVHMVQLANAVLPVSDFNKLETTVYTNSAENEIQVFLEGRYAFTFPAEDLQNRSREVAVRALGPVTFTDFTVRGR